MAAENQATDRGADIARPLLVGLALTVLAGWIDAVDSCAWVASIRRS
jgi:hypothetical protein